jgi:hypothetical protein
MSHPKPIPFVCYSALAHDISMRLYEIAMYLILTRSLTTWRGSQNALGIFLFADVM